MGRIAAALAMTLVLLIASAGGVFAEWRFNVSNPSGDQRSFEITYVSDGETLTVSAYTLYLTDNPSAASITVAHHPPGTLFDLGSGDRENGDIVISAVAIPRQTGTWSNGAKIANLTTDRPCTLSWKPEAHSFKVLVSDEGVLKGEDLTLTRDISAPCPGDCNRDGKVTVDELVESVNVALGGLPLGECPPCDTDQSGDVTVEELIQAVNAALTGCSRLIMQ